MKPLRLATLLLALLLSGCAAPRWEYLRVFQGANSDEKHGGPYLGQYSEPPSVDLRAGR